ncbi:TetR/AcrR family transcriptional regulator [Spiribacter sp. 1M153]|uniref:TetR/AcrR family transcriptional regulator n=1 Tax=Spiribacter roseus TaxID=1855875 RepID=UPI00349F0C14
MPRTATHSRDKSLDRALNLFWRQGFTGTSLRDIENVLDMRPGSIYATFGSKHALFSEALDRYAARTMAELEATIAAEPSPIAGLAAYIRMLGRLRERGDTTTVCMLVKSLIEFGDCEAVVRSKVDDLLARMEARFIDRLGDAQALGEVPKGLDPERLGRRLQADIVGLRTYAARGVDNQAINDLAEDIALDWEQLRR